MDLRRRFIFRGNAAAIGGRIVRPVDLMLESSTASSLTVVGGRSRAEVGATRFGDLVSFGAASTSAEGVFDDVQRQVELTYHRVTEDALTTATHVTADVKGFSVNIDPGFTVKRVHAALRSTSPTGSGEPAIAVTNDTVIEGAAIGGPPLIIELCTPVFQRYDTRSKLLAAADNPDFVKESADCLFMRASMGGTPPPATARLLHSSGTTYATIVKSIRWAGDPHPAAQIEHHSIIVRDFGRIFFGELLVTDQSRRLTMLRFELGSPVGGSAACAEVDSNGTWS
jgi:hypothetical protein